MLKKIAFLFVCVLGMALFSACDDSTNKFSDISSMSEKDYADAFNDVVGANLVTNVLDKHNRYKITAQYYDIDETTVINTETYYISSDKIYFDNSTGEKTVFEKGENYGYDSNQKMPYYVFFLNDSLYNDKFNAYFDRLIYVSNQYKVKEIKEEEGLIVINGQLSYEELLKIEGQNVDWIHEGEIYSVDFYINKDTLEAEKIQYKILSGESSRLIAQITYEYDIDDFNADETLYTQTHGEGRTATIIQNPGSESEESFSLKVPLKCDIVYYYDNTINYYYDLEKTNLYTYDMHNTDSDETIYCFTSSVDES